MVSNKNILINAWLRQTLYKSNKVDENILQIL